VKFFIIDFQASDETLCSRLRQRRDDASEATIDVLYQQQQSAEPLWGEEQNHVITINTESDAVLETLFSPYKKRRVALKCLNCSNLMYYIAHCLSSEAEQSHNQKFVKYSSGVGANSFAPCG